MNNVAISAGLTPDRTVLEAQGLAKRFHEGPLDVTVLHGVDLAVHAGETLAIVGQSGSGKSTLLHLLGGLDAPTTGSVRLMGQDFSGLSPAAQGTLRNTHLGFVYQFHHLLPEFSALENVAMPLWIRRQSRDEAARVAERMLVQVGLTLLWPQAMESAVWRGEAYRDEMFGWIRTGAGVEGDIRQFLPVHLMHLGLFCLLSLVSGGLFGLVQPNFRLAPGRYFDDYTHRTIFTDVSLTDWLSASGFEIAASVPRFLPLTVKSRLGALTFLVPLYLRSPWRPFAGQMFVLARRPGDGVPEAPGGAA